MLEGRVLSKNFGLGSMILEIDVVDVFEALCAVSLCCFLFAAALSLVLQTSRYLPASIWWQMGHLFFLFSFSKKKSGMLVQRQKHAESCALVITLRCVA